MQVICLEGLEGLEEEAFLYSSCLIRVNLIT